MKAVPCLIIGSILLLMWYSRKKIQGLQSNYTPYLS